MSVLEYEGKRPSCAGARAADSAVLIGEVTLGKNSSVWYGAVLRGDCGAIAVGENSNIQDGCTVHCSLSGPVTVGKNCVVGHNAILHSCTVEDGCLIGMGAILLDGCVIGSGSIVGAGSLVPPGKIIPPESLVMGSPCRVVRRTKPKDREDTLANAREYLSLAEKQLPLL